MNPGGDISLSGAIATGSKKYMTERANQHKSN
jgi:hypothetical protein